MEMEKTMVTKKYQTTIPKRIRKKLGVRAGDKVLWHTIRELIVIDVHKKIKNPVEFLISQIKLDMDAVKLVKGARSEMA